MIILPSPAINSIKDRIQKVRRNQGKKQIGGKDYLVLEQTYADGHKVTHYIDPKTYLTYKTVTTAQGMMGAGEVEEENFLSDYKKVNGVMIAHTTTALHDGQQVFTMSYTEVKLNTGLEDSLFKPLFHEGRSRQV
jgi:hypothetical protein